MPPKKARFNPIQTPQFKASDQALKLRRNLEDLATQDLQSGRKAARQLPPGSLRSNIQRGLGEVTGAVRGTVRQATEPFLHAEKKTDDYFRMATGKDLEFSQHLGTPPQKGKAMPPKKKPPMGTSLDEAKKRMDGVAAQQNTRARQVGQAPPNPNVARMKSDFGTRAAGTAGRAMDPISGQPMQKGSPVAAQNMSRPAQAARQFSNSVDDALLGPFKKKKR